MKSLPALALLVTSTGALATPLSVDAPLTSHAVLQRDREIPIGGSAEPGARVTVTFDGASKTAKADKDGRWQVKLPPHDAGGPYTIQIASGDEDATLDDLMVGDVWLCSGQSNMEFTLRHASNSDAEVAWAANPMLRLFNVPRQSNPAPMETLAQPTSWQAASSQSAADFSAACFLMGRELQTHQDIPIGLIASSWGGSVIEDWISRESLQTVPRYLPALALLDAYAKDQESALAAWTSMFDEWLGTAATPAANANWRPVPGVQPWEQWGDPALAGFDGIGYYRVHVTLSPDQVGKAKLAIGAVDDIDMTSINGKLVGSTSTWNQVREYDVLADILKPGDNVIEVTAIDTGGGGGMWGGEPRTLTLDDGTVLPLTGWTFAKGKDFSDFGMPPSVPWLGGSGRTTLFNGMIAPLHNYPLKGFAWYQGEANASDAKGYAELMPLLIADWRKRFGASTFLMVQLANFGPLSSTPTDDAWAQLRDVQRRVADADPGVGMASAIDIGQVGDIHPTNKQDVGRRLALGARHIALGEDVEDRGPAPLSASRTEQGIAVSFGHGPLKLVAGGEAIGFELCNAASQCRFVSGQLSGDTILLPSDPTAREVRYLWQASPLVNLYNEAGLPATGFALPIE